MQLYKTAREIVASDGNRIATGTEFAYDEGQRREADGLAEVLVYPALTPTRIRPFDLLRTPRVARIAQ